VSEPLVRTVERHLENLVDVYPDRHPGRPGNSAANDYVEAVLGEHGWAVESVDLEALDCETGAARLTIEGSDQLILPGPTLGQVTDVGAVRGTVVGLLQDQTDRSVLVLLDNGLRTHADDEGRFTLFPVPAGQHRIAAVSSGCGVAVGELEMIPGQELAVQLHLPAPVQLGATAKPSGRESTRSEGVAVGVLTAADIKRMKVSTVEEAIRRVSPRMLMTTGADYGRGMRVEGARGTNSIVGSNVPLIFVDGIRLDQASTMSLHSVNVEEVDRIEIVKGASGGWAYGQGGANGVIRIYTRNSSASIDPNTPPEACGFTFSEKG
jgi:hypothetical protein